MEAAKDCADCALFRPLLASPNLGEELSTRISLKVFHCPHEGHLPIHFGDSWPQLEHTYAILSFAISSAKITKNLHLCKFSCMIVSSPILFSFQPWLNLLIISWYGWKVILTCSQAGTDR